VIPWKYLWARGLSPYVSSAAVLWCIAAYLVKQICCPSAVTCGLVLVGYRPLKTVVYQSCICCGIIAEEDAVQTCCSRVPLPYFYVYTEGAAFHICCKDCCCGCCLSLAVCAASSPSQLIFVTAFAYGVLEPTMVARVNICSRSEGLHVKGFCFGVLVFSLIPQPYWLSGMKVPSLLWHIKISYWSLNWTLTEHINWNYTTCGCCDSFWGRVLYQVCFPLVFFVLGLTLLEICLRSLSRALTLFFLDLLLYYSMIWLHRSTAVVYDLKLAHHIDLLLFELSLKLCR